MSFKSIQSKFLDIRQLDSEQNRENWKPGDGSGVKKCQDNWKIYKETVTYNKDGIIELPPQRVKLADFWVLIIARSVGQRSRYQHLPYDFDSQGSVRVNRVPRSPYPVTTMHGVPWLHVLQGFYILTGDDMQVPWILLEDPPEDGIGGSPASSSLAQGSNGNDKVKPPQAYRQR